MSNFKEVLEKYFLFFDLLIASILFFLSRFLVYKFLNYKIESFLTNYDDVYSVLFTSGLTLLGFLITGISIIVGFLMNDKLSKLRKTQHPKTIVQIYKSAIFWTFLFIIGSFIGMFQTKELDILLLVICFSIFITIIRIFRCIWILSKLVEIVE